MGLNTAALILNDALHTIRRDPEIGDKIDNGIATAHRMGGDIAAHSANGTHIGAIQVLPSQHADYVQIVAVGGNCIRRLGTVRDISASDGEDHLSQVRHLLDRAQGLSPIHLLSRYCNGGSRLRWTHVLVVCSREPMHGIVMPPTSGNFGE